MRGTNGELVWEDMDLDKSGRLGRVAGGLVIQGLGSDAGIIDLDQTIEFMNVAEELQMSR